MVERENGRCRVAVACEGGGSHTAFTAGVLDRLLRERSIEIVALSGTSGGAVCATLAWRGLLEGSPDDARRRLAEFWAATATRGVSAAAEALVRFGIRMVGDVVSPEVSPYRVPVDLREPFRKLLEGPCDLDAVPRLLAADRSAPRLLISATDVLSGEFTLFRSHAVTHRDTRYPAAAITTDVLIASAAVPTLFRAVHIDRRDYWDGVFAQNPPIRELPDLVRTMPAREPPDEIWVIRINPTTRRAVPRAMADIRDRRNELSGNISLEQELYFIDFINRLCAARAAGGHSDPPTKHRPIALRSIAMQDEFAQPLDLESKLDRAAPHIEALQRHGREQADAFLRDHARSSDPTSRPPAPARRRATP
jgi:NTE family protein